MCRIYKYDVVCEKCESYNVDFIDRRMTDSAQVARFIMETLQSDRYPVEHFMEFMLDTKLKIIGFCDLVIGTADSAPIHPRDIFAPAIASGKCAAIIVAHNHPSGDPTPSQPDIDVTERLYKASEIMGIRLLDHIVVGDGCYTSMKVEGYLD